MTSILFIAKSTKALSLFLLAADAGSEPQFESGSSLLLMLVQTFLVLAFVCGLAYVVVRLLPRSAGIASQNSMLKIVDRVPVDQRRSILVVNVAGQWLLVGSSEGGVNLICELDPETAQSEAEKIARSRTRVGDKATMFADRLAELMKRKR